MTYIVSFGREAKQVNIDEEELEEQSRFYKGRRSL